MRIEKISPKKSIEDNLKYWCFEEGTDFEEPTKHAARLFSNYISGSVADLGCGDGVAEREFIKNHITVTGVDINDKKLAKLPRGAIPFCGDFISFLESVDHVDNVFMHHSLEHYSDPKSVLKLITEKVSIGGMIYIAVPRGDTPHSVHAVAFDSVDEIRPNATALIKDLSSEEEWAAIFQR